MKNYDEMSDFEISKKVAEVVYGASGVMELTYAHNKSSAVWSCPADGLKSFDINNPSDAWPIIVDNGISIIRWSDYWTCEGFVGEFDKVAAGSDNNPLRAAMICFLMMNDAEQ